MLIGGGKLNSQIFIVPLSNQIKFNYYGKEID